MSKDWGFPSSIHQQAAETVVGFFSNDSQTHAVLLVNSCARGKAVAESDLDIAILVDPATSNGDRQSLERQWQACYAARPVFRQLEQLSRFACVHLDLFDGCWRADRWDDGGGPDCFEIEIGNRVAYAVPLWERTSAFADLRAKWLPYYGEPLRQERLLMVKEACRINIARLQVSIGRSQYFYAFDRLQHAFQEFLQAVFIAHRVYPIAYNKWIREQVEGWLELRALYTELAAIFQVRRLESNELLEKAESLSRLLDTWTSSGSASE
jgi:predicted nucleotidyltransferase